MTAAPNTFGPDIDFAQWEVEPEDAARIHPAGVWRQDVVDFYALPPENRGDALPWSKTHGHFRMRPGELTIWAGPNGCGKSLVLSQVVLDLQAQGRTSVIASLEMSPVSTLARMCRQACRTAEPGPVEVSRFLEAVSNGIWLYDQVGTIHAQRMLGVLRYSREEIGADHVVIDSLMKCGISTEDLDAQKRFIDRLSTYAKDSGLHIHLVCHNSKAGGEESHGGKYGIKGASEISDMADNVILCWRNRAKEHKRQAGELGGSDAKAPDAMLTIDKQRHGEWEGRIALWFVPPAMQYVARDTTETIDYMRRLAAKET